MSYLNYGHLRYFWAVARHGSLLKASRELHLTPQTISSQLRILEENLGENLFDRVGRRLVLTEAGRVALRFADEIFSLGQELTNTFAGRQIGHTRRLVIGVANVLPKLVAERLISPALQLDEPVRVLCREAGVDSLLAEMALNRVDVVLTDTPTPPGVKIHAFNHLLGSCGVVFVASAELMHRYQKGFPYSLHAAPFLLPTEDTTLRHSLDQWFSKHEILPKIVGEFQNSALLKAFGQTATGIFAIPSVIEDEVIRQYMVATLGRTNEITEKFYAITTEKRIRHSAIAAICNNARSGLFG